MLIQCSQCGYPYPDKGLPHHCPACGGIFDITEIESPFPGHMKDDQPGMWQYAHSFGLPDGCSPVTLGEGSTPLVWARKHGSEIGLKLENLNPTGSYKDRGSAVLINHMIVRGVTNSVEDSSGNAGASHAAYAARAGIPSTIYIPQNTSGAKREQIEIFGARIVEVAGERSAAAAAVLDAVTGDVVYASHAYLPFGLVGVATIAFEIWQNGDEIGSIVAPVGHGGLLYGIMHGYSALESAHVLQRMPYMVGVQAKACAPAVTMYYSGMKNADEIVIGSTLAEGVRVSKPARADKIIEWMGKDRGHFIAVGEDEIIQAAQEMAHLGVHVEPTSALAWAALDELIGKIPEPIILILTGSGLKYHELN